MFKLNLTARWAAASLLAVAAIGCDDEGGTAAADEDMGTSGCETGAIRGCTTTNGVAGMETCLADGSWGQCVGGGSPEMCNGLDDDGDGATDEDVAQRACNTACGSSVERCEGGNWVGCQAPQPAAEVCDGMDNDCDGKVDEEITRACDGECGTGMERCSVGNWVGCTAPPAMPEVCDGMDNDCDGETDESLARGCMTACGQGAETCTNGQFGDCSAPAPADMDTCGNDVDEDCDGQADEGCDACIPESTTICSVNEGVCEQGVKTCDAEGEWGPCLKDGNEVVSPGDQPETCSGSDDDCDGNIDESFEGQGEACGVDVGACQVGIQACRDGEAVCVNEIAPRDEVCDGVDNNCDGTVDEDLAGDQWENNQVCAEAENIGDIREGAEEPRIFTGSVYPDGDIDYYGVNIEESSDFCVPGFGQDSDYQVVIALSNLPEGLDFELCVTVSREDEIGDACADEEPVGEEFCNSDVVNGAIGITYTVPGRCALTDDTISLIKVSAGAEQNSCQPYTVSVYAETVEDVEE